ncbi:hypothetical protein CRYUN_Cryun20dG0053700 [Craigia yunnanensis]
MQCLRKLTELLQRYTYVNQYTFPGEFTTVKVRYADAKRDRLGLLPDKLYVGCLNKQASKREIEEIFSPYGHVQDIYIVCDEHRENCAQKDIKIEVFGVSLGTCAFNSISSGHHPRVLAMRSVPILGDPTAGRIPPHPLYLAQHILTNSQPQGVSH